MSKKTHLFLVILGILFISFNLRAPITAVGSVVSMIKLEYGLTDAVAGIITTIPLLAFGVVSPFVAQISKKIGHSITMLIGLILIFLGEIIRSYAGIPGLFIGTTIIGMGIAIGNVIIPSIIKLYFPARVGLISSIYTSGMCIFAAVGAGVSVPVAEGLGFGWHNALASWFILTILTILIWLPQLFHKDEKVNGELKPVENVEVKPEVKVKTKSIWASPLAWWVTVFMGIQSLIFYSLVAWLPTIVESKGLGGSFPSTMALVFQLVAIPATIVVPILCDKIKDQRGLVLVVCLIYATGMLCFLFGTSKALMIVAIILMSLGMGGSISLSIAFISLRSPNAQRASELSGMSQSAGYIIAAGGPFLAGLIHDNLQDWTIPVVMFLVLIAILAICGMFAGKNKVVDEGIIQPSENINK